MDKIYDRRVTCCFTGHRPVKLTAPEKAIRQWLEKEIDRAAADGYRTFITGCAMGVDTWAGQIVLEKKQADPDIRLVAANPWPEMADSWKPFWRDQHRELLEKADEVVQISDGYSKFVYRKRNCWMVDRSSRLIACYNGTPGGTLETILYAEKNGLEVIRYGC